MSDLPPELLVEVAAQLVVPEKAAPRATWAASRGLMAMQRTCCAWNQLSYELCWRVLTLRRFPLVEGILRLQPTNKSWKEIYRLQHRSVQKPAPKAQDFVLSFELTTNQGRWQQVLLEQSAKLLPAQHANTRCDLRSAPLWDKAGTPTLVRNWQRALREEDDSESELKVWATRDMRTVQLYKGSIDSGAPDWSLSFVPFRLVVAAKPEAPARVDPHMLIMFRFRSETGQLMMQMQYYGEQAEEEEEDEGPHLVEATASMMLQHLNMLLPAL